MLRQDLTWDDLAIIFALTQLLHQPEVEKTTSVIIKQVSPTSHDRISYFPKKKNWVVVPQLTWVRAGAHLAVKGYQVNLQAAYNSMLKGGYRNFFYSSIGPVGHNI